ncbi:Catalase [Phytophthora megakarya]|uniref:Catalase n=1 Tax=Phytophthora megakarya TaxID=4795 RepID=A0A225UWM1_9STRA|nr:Catalase [Phytophthora megakarya]
MAPLKILIVGPKEAGKSTIANFLAEHSDRLGGQERYQPTIGVRILEIEKGKANVELWDVSGDQKYLRGVLAGGDEGYGRRNSSLQSGVACP